MSLKRIPVVFLFAIVLYGCAKFVPPTGGDRDITPPKLIKSTPVDKQLNFKERQIRLLFDELVDSKNLKQELIITPEQKGRYKVRNRGEEVELEFEEGFEENTTYTLSFGAGIKDINEQNKADNLKLVFSTGSELDSLKVGGSVTNLFTKEGVIGATIGLYKMSSPDTLPLINRKPDYFIKSDSSGNFQLENLKSDNYRILSFTDKNGNQKFDNKKEMFGFIQDTIKLSENKAGISLELFPYDTIPPKYKRFIQKEKTYALKFDESLYKVEVGFEEKSDSIPYIIIEDEVRFFKMGTPKDSVMISLILSDSLLNNDTLKHTITFREEDQRSKQSNEILKISVTPTNSSSTTQNEPYIFSFDYPLIQIDSNKISVSDDTLNTVRYKARFVDSSKTRVEVSLLERITKSVVLKADKGAFINILSDSSTAFTLKNPLLNKSELGLIAGNIEIRDSVQAQYIIQLLNATNNKIERVLISQDGKFTFENIRPEEYTLQAIVDSNSNGVWDTANFGKGTPPERVINLKEPIRVKANFEFRDINIPNQ
ncbi:MAG: hypothetical protein ACI9V1_001073 [Spirosomataceae bacterium]|jgi:uncharacterized protein (DUF2141 family)